MTEEETEQSLRERGFLSPVIAEATNAYRQHHAPMFELADELNLLGQRQLLRGCDKAITLGSLDPLNLGTRLFIRTMSNFQGAILLIERGMTVEAQSLIRACYENSFWIAAFVRKPAEAVAKFELAEKKSQESRGEALQRIADAFGSAALSALLTSRRPKTPGKAIGLEDLAKLGGLHANFAFYKQLSADSAHPSLHSIDRYLDKDAEGNWTGFVLGPDNDGLGDALSMGCHALISALAAFGELLNEPSDDDQRLFGLNERYKVLAGISTE